MLSLTVVPLLLCNTVLPAVNCQTDVLCCHYPPLRLYHNYLLICLGVCLSAFSAPIFNHPSITKRLLSQSCFKII